jgi:hypothetical protein
MTSPLPQKGAVLPPTPNNTPETSPMKGSFDEERDSEMNQMADFIPPWGASGHGSLTGALQALTDRLPSNSRCSTPKPLVVPTLVQISSLPGGSAEVCQPPPQEPSQSFRKAGVRAFNQGKTEMYEKYGSRGKPGGIITIDDIQRDARERMEAGRYVGIENLDGNARRPRSHLPLSDEDETLSDNLVPERVVI